MNPAEWKTKTWTANEFVTDYDGQHAKKYKRLMASLLNENGAPIYKVLIEVESAELQTTAEASLIAALMPFDITNENRGEWSTTRAWTNTKKRAVGRSREDQKRRTMA
ncbi:hypothetical protein WR25_06993 [Diploscapter pachys]|uniref:Uncharacterized protein n=1 Tax=Diploscapter pachys TaxID=2018661 RepID=A0A2A2LWW0_9BILA|nr:hypothetical protein WR25_06993 [Diploscapter pachys]